MRLLIQKIKCKAILAFDCCHSGTLLDLRYQYVDSDNYDKDTQNIKNQILLTADMTKGSEARIVFVNEKLRKELQAYVNSIPTRAPEAAFFYTQKHPRRGFTPNTLTQHFHYLYKRAGVAGASSHSGRKTFITSLASQGISVFVLASLAGHKSISTTQRYVSVNDDMKRRAVELV